MCHILNSSNIAKGKRFLHKKTPVADDDENLIPRHTYKSRIYTISSPKTEIYNIYNIESSSYEFNLRNGLFKLGILLQNTLYIQKEELFFRLPYFHSPTILSFSSSAIHIFLFLLLFVVKWLSRHPYLWE